jgi:8-oxo-dGTP diphosphatase
MKTVHTSKSASLYPDRPRAAAGAIVFKENRVLLVLRGQPPAEKMWAVPGGSVELGETLQQAAEREVYEETGIVIQAGEPVFTFDSIVRDDSGQVQFHYVIADLIADYVSGEPRPGDDALDARWVSAQEMKTLNVNSKTVELLREKFGWE